MSKNGVRHITTAPYHPASSGLAEREVGTFKGGIIKMKGSDENVKLHRFLFTYRCIPHSTTGFTLSVLVMGRRLRSALDRLKPNLNRKMEVTQESFHKTMSKGRSFTKGDGVYVKNFSSGPKWLSGKVSEYTGPVSYLILLTDGRSLRRHVDHIRRKMDIIIIIIIITLFYVGYT